MVTTIGFGDIYPSRTDERLFTVILMLFGIIFYTFTVGNISAMLSNGDLRDQKLIASSHKKSYSL